MPVKAISLWQPWASLVAIGMKPDETRSWPAPKSLIGQDLAICSALRQKPLEEDVKDKEARVDIRAALLNAGIREGLPYGRALCVVTVIACFPTEEFRNARTPTQRHFGDYSDGRFAWLLADVRRFRFPPHVCGRQGLFDFTPPEGMFGEFEA